MRVLITGGFGHIGSALIADLVNNKKIKEIIVIDNFITNRFNSYINLKKKKLTVFDEDILNFNFNKLNNIVDYVIHLAAITNAEKSFEQGAKVIRHNLNGTRKVVEFVKKNNIGLIFASSTSVYGNQFRIINSKNNLVCLNPQSPYANSKILEEDLIKSKLIKYCIMRFGTISGFSDGIRFHTAVNKFCYQAAFNKPLSIWTKFYRKKRPYLSLVDCVNSIHFVIKKNLFNQMLLDVVTENLKVIEIVSEIKKYKKIKINYVQTKMLNQFSYEVHSDKIINYGFKFRGKIFKDIKYLLKNLIC